jgi:hypothetical protein
LLETKISLTRRTARGGTSCSVIKRQEFEEGFTDFLDEYIWNGKGPASSVRLYNVLIAEK